MPGKHEIHCIKPIMNGFVHIHKLRISCISFLELRKNTWKLYLFLEHQYQPVSSFLLTAAILVYPYLQLRKNEEKLRSEIYHYTLSLC